MKILNLSSKALAILSIFGGTSLILLKRYSTETTTQLVESTSSIGIIPTIFLGVIVFVVLLYVTNGLKQSLRESKFGWLAIIFFGLMLGIVLFSVWFIFNSILISIQMSVEDYIAVMEYHRQTVYYMLYPIAAGLSIGVMSKLIEIDIIKKLFGKLFT